MTMCSDGHDEICYEGQGFNSSCPCCELLAEIKLREKDIDELQEEVQSLKEEKP